jgi:tRNA nucleotidyltransferase (CCA-adding enzyme)
MNLERLREKVIEQYYPEKEELQQIKDKYREISDFIEQEFDVNTHFAGSAGRRTCMKGDKDLDIFVPFDEDVGKKELENRGLEIGKKVFEEFDGEYRIEYAEHPYTKGEINGHEVEIVPCYDTSPEDIKSSVDRTPHHSQWVDQNLDEEERKDVVMLKRFLSAEGIYGSSLKIRGFSGYLCEVLISHYGGFEELIDSATKWQENQIIDAEEHHEGKLPDSLKNKFKDEPFVVIDPVDPERNVASVLSKENFARFVHTSWKFQKNPGIKFFEEEEPEYTQFEVNQELKKRADFIVIEFEEPEEVEDVIYPQMRKTLGRLKILLNGHDFRIFNSGFHVAEPTRIFFELESTLPEIQEIKGPKVFHGKDHLDQFTSKYENVYIQEDRIVAKTEREYPEAKELLKDFLESDLEEKGISSHIAEKMKDYNFADPATDDGKWLNYLGKKLHVEDNQRGEQ